MKWFLALWALPLVLFWGWFGLSYYDLNFGYLILSRQLHDLLFELYGQILGVDPRALPMMAAKACVFDSLLLTALLAFRRRRAIRDWIKARRAAYSLPSPAPSA